MRGKRTFAVVLVWLLVALGGQPASARCATVGFNGVSHTQCGLP